MNTSASNPIRVDWVIELATAPRLKAAAAAGGELGMTFLPGKQGYGVHEQHSRDLRTDVARLRSECGVDTFLLLVEDQELQAARVADIHAVMAAHGIELLRFPIVDTRVPTDRAALRTVLDDVLARLASGQKVVVACRGGLGRTGTIVGCLLRDGGLDGQSAIERTRVSRKLTIEPGIQESFVKAWDWPERGDAPPRPTGDEA